MKNTKSSDSYRNNDYSQTKPVLHSQMHHEKEILNLLARIRCLEDDLQYQQLKNQQINNKYIQHIKLTQQMHVKMITMQDQLSMFRDNQILQRKKSQQILKYQENILSIGDEISALNDCLVRKNYECQSIVKQNQDLKDFIDNLQKQIKSYQNKEGNYQKQIYDIVDLINSDIQAPSFSDSISLNLDVIKSAINNIKTQKKTLKQVFEKNKRQISEQLIREKQKSIKLDYQIKLLKQRTKDAQKTQTFAKICTNDQKIEQVIQDLLKKQDQLINKIEQLEREKQEMRESFEDQLVSRESSYGKQLQQFRKIIIQREKQNKLLKKEIEKSKQNNRLSIQKYQKSLQVINHQINRNDPQDDIIIMKKIRNVEEQNRFLKIKVQQLQSQNKILQTELEILKQ